jgi:hypothetical protein
MVIKLSMAVRVEVKVTVSGFHVLLAFPAAWKKFPAAVVAMAES